MDRLVLGGEGEDAERGPDHLAVGRQRLGLWFRRGGGTLEMNGWVVIDAHDASVRASDHPATPPPKKNT